MKDTENALKEELLLNFKGHGQRLTMMSKLVLAILKMCTVNFAQLALVLNSSVKPDSNFKRIQRFVKGYRFCQRCFVQFAWSLYGKQGQWIALSMDRTNWKFGQLNINILTIGISWQGTAIPLIWMLLDKRGNSNQQERILLLERLLTCLDEKQQNKIRYLLMDREFVGHDWLTYLRSKPFSFIIRIRKNTTVRMPGEHKEKAVHRLFETSHYRVLKKHRVLYGHRLYLAGQKISAKEYLILISDQRLAHSAQLYGERWGIEVFFGACKTRGFNFEDTHLTKLERINTLCFVIAIAYIWAFKTGEFLIKNGHQIPIKQLKNRKAKLKSIFRVGLDFLKHKLLNFLSLFDHIGLLSCT